MVELFAMLKIILMQLADMICRYDPFHLHFFQYRILSILITVLFLRSPVFPIVNLTDSSISLSKNVFPLTILHHYNKQFPLPPLCLVLSVPFMLAIIQFSFSLGGAKPKAPWVYWLLLPHNVLNLIYFPWSISSILVIAYFDIFVLHFQLNILSSILDKHPLFL